MTVTLGQMDWRLGVDSTGFQQGLSNAESQAKGFGKSITGALATGAKLAFAGAAVGVGALGAVLVSSVKDAAAAEEATAQLNAVLESTKGIAGMTREALEEHALALSKVTRFEDDAILAGNAVMLTFTNIGKDIFPRATQATLDLSTAFGMDLQSATMMVGKALNDPIAGITALSKAGVQFTADQKEMIKGMVEAGNAAGAQKLILAELELQIGGSAVAAGSTMTGQMEIMKNALGNVKEEIGNALLPVLTEMLQKIGPGFIEGATQFADWFVTTGLPALQQFGNFIAFQVYPVLDRFGKWFEVTILPHLRAFGNFIVVSVIPALQQFGGWINTTVIPALQTLGEWLGPRLSGVLENLGRLFEGITLIVQGTITVFQGVVEWAQKAAETIQSAIDAIREFLGLDASRATSGTYGVTPTAPTAGPVYGSTPTAPSAGAGYGTTPTRNLDLAPITVNVYAAGGNMEQVRSAANTGTLEALRARGYR